MTHPQAGPAGDPPSPFFDSLLVFLGPPALGFEGAWAAFQRAADQSVSAGRSHPWWAAEEQLFAAISQPTNGEDPPVEAILSAVLGRRIRATARLHLVHYVNQWLPAIAIRLHGVRDAKGMTIGPAELVDRGEQIAAAFGLALARSWVRWMAPIGPAT